jgi:hypothetical protein
MDNGLLLSQFEPARIPETFRVYRNQVDSAARTSISKPVFLSYLRHTPAASTLVIQIAELVFIQTEACIKENKRTYEHYLGEKHYD